MFAVGNVSVFDCEVVTGEIPTFSGHFSELGTDAFIWRRKHSGFEKGPLPTTRHPASQLKCSFRVTYSTSCTSCTSSCSSMPSKVGTVKIHVVSDMA